MRKILVFYIFIAVLTIPLVSFFFLYKKNEQSAEKKEQARALTDKIELADSDIPLSEPGSSVSAKIITKNTLGIKRKELPLSDNLPFESYLISGNSLDLQKIQSLFFSKKFDAQVDFFISQSAADSNASELSFLYRKMLEDQLKNNNIKAQIRNFACGVSICVGSLEGAKDSEYSRWSNIFFSDPTIPSYGFTNSTIPLGPNEFEHRFAFSTDPVANSIMVPRK